MLTLVRTSLQRNAARYLPIPSSRPTGRYVTVDDGACTVMVTASWPLTWRPEHSKIINVVFHNVFIC